MKPKVRVPLFERIKTLERYFCTSCQQDRPTEGGEVVIPVKRGVAPRFKCGTCKRQERPGVRP